MQYACYMHNYDACLYDRVSLSHQVSSNDFNTIPPRLCNLKVLSSVVSAEVVTFYLSANLFLNKCTVSFLSLCFGYFKRKFEIKSIFKI